MKKRKPFVVTAGVGAVLSTIGATEAMAQASATMGVSVTINQVVSISARGMSVSALPVVASGAAQVSAPSAATAVGSIGGAALGNGSVAATVGAFAFTRNAPVSITPGTAEAVLACRGTAASSPTLAVTVALAATSYGSGGTVGTSCTATGTAACGIYVLPALTFPADVGTGGCTNATITIPLTYGTA